MTTVIARMYPNDAAAQAAADQLNSKLIRPASLELISPSNMIIPVFEHVSGRENVVDRTASVRL